MPIVHDPIEKILFPDTADPKRQSFELPGTRRPAQTGMSSSVSVPYLEETDFA